MKEKGFNILEIQDKLANYCSYRDRSHKEVDAKLNEYGAIPEAKDMIFLFLMRENFLNEERYAKSYARGKFYQNKWGKRKIVHGLKFQNIPPKLISTALKEINVTDYKKTLIKLIETKKALIKGNDEKKLIRYLQQKGYDYNEFKEFLKAD